MLRSRMFTPGFKLFFGFAAFLLFGALIFAISSTLQAGGEGISKNLEATGIIQTVTGPLSVGWKGPVGNHLGYTVLLGGAGIAAFVGIVLVAFRDADPEAEAQLLEVETVPLTRAPQGTNFAPVVGAFALGVTGLGWVVSTPLFYAGLALLFIVMGTWTVRAWAERATGDDEVNHQIYARLIDPLRVPIVGAIMIGFVVFGLSRVLLAAPNKAASSLIFGVAATLFFLGVCAVYFSPKAGRALTVGFLAIGALAILGGGVWGIVAGERPVEHHGPKGEHVTDSEGHSPSQNQQPGAPASQEHGLAPSGAGATR